MTTKIKTKCNTIRKVAVLIGISRSFERQILKGIIKYSHLHGPWSFYLESLSHYFELDEPDIKLSFANQWHPDGIIVCYPKNINKKLFKRNVPIIGSEHLKSKKLSKVPYIKTNNHMVAKIATEHLFEHGLKNVAYCGFTDILWSQEREESFGKYVSKTDCNFYIYKRPLFEFHSKCDVEQKAMAKWLLSLPKPIGIMACNDDHGRYVAMVCKASGLNVPNEIAIIGVDNDKLICEVTDPPLSSIALNLERAGYEAAELLDKLMSGKEKMDGQAIKINPTHVVDRTSTDIFTIKDPELSEALRFIQNHSKENIQVVQVVEASGVSRRELQRRFRKELNSTILDEIRRARVKRIAIFLAETNLPVYQIALALGYTSEHHIARFFRKEMGMSPIAYRKLYGPK